MVVAVTGASGFLGGHLADVLAARGHAVRAVVRNPEKSPALRDLGCTFATADLSDSDALARAFEGADAVVANAALAIRHDRPYAEFLSANVGGTENTLRAAAKAGVKRVVYVSSVSVHQILNPWGHFKADAPYLSDTTSKLTLNHLTTAWKYSLTKSLAEKRAWVLAEELGLKLTTVRPGPIYGPRDHKLTARYAAQMARSHIVAPTARAPHVHAVDVAGAIAGALGNDASIGKPYLLGGPSESPYTVLTIWKRLAGRGPVIVPLPLPAHLSFDDEPATRDLGFSPRGIEDGLRTVVS